jgi:serine/threonine protein kinase
VFLHLLSPLQLLVDEEQKVLGRGGFGDALLCLHKGKGMLCAVKKMPKIEQTDGSTDAVQTMLFEQEVKAMAALSSPYLVKILDAFEETNYQYIVMEYCENGNLRDFLKRREKAGNPLSEKVFSS